MKKLFALLLSLTLLTSVGTSVAFAEDDYYQAGGYWVYDAEMTDEILSCEAGIASETWTVPYLSTAPVMDGSVEEDEYRRFEGFEGYMSLMARIGNETYGNTKEEFDYFRVQADTFGGTGGFIKPYWGWDGTYLYMAFEVQNLSGFHCTPQDTFYLYAYNCLQVGIGDEYTSGNDFSELGFGVNSETGEPITHVWLSDYVIQSGDFGGHYDEDSGIVTYECRIRLMDTTLGYYLDEGETIRPGDTMKFSWLLSVNGANNRTSDSGEEGEEWQVAFCHGIGGPYSHKVSEYFALATFGAPEGEELDTEAETVEESVEDTTPDTAPDTIPETAPVTDAESATDAETVADTTPVSETVTEPNGTAPETKPADKGGCGAVLTAGIGALTMSIFGTAILLRKKED